MAKNTTDAAPAEAANDNLSEASLMGLLGAVTEDFAEVESEEESEDLEQAEEADEFEEESDEEAEEEESEPEDDQPEAEENPKKGQRKLDARFRKLTQERNALKAEIQRLKNGEGAADPLAIDSNESNPFKGVETVEALKNQKKNLTETLKFTERLLDDHDDSHLDDVIHTEGDKEFTKRQIKQANRNAREALDEHIPAQLKVIENAEKREQSMAAFVAKAEQDVPAITEEGSTVKQAYEAMMASPHREAIRKHVPEIYPELPWLFAHAANSIYGGAKKAVKVNKASAAPNASVRVPSAPTRGAAVSHKPAMGVNKAASAAKAAFDQSGRSSDLERLLAATPFR